MESLGLVLSTQTKVTDFQPEPFSHVGDDTARQWRDYRIQLRLWTDTNPDFPDISKRPVQPS